MYLDDDLIRKIKTGAIKECDLKNTEVLVVDQVEINKAFNEYRKFAIENLPDTKVKVTWLQPFINLKDYSKVKDYVYKMAKEKGYSTIEASNVISKDGYKGEEVVIISDVNEKMSMSALYKMMNLNFKSKNASSFAKKMVKEIYIVADTIFSPDTVYRFAKKTRGLVDEQIFLNKIDETIVVGK